MNSGGLQRVKRLAERIATSRVARMFGRNTVANAAAFLLDLLILWCLVELAGMAYLTAAVVAFFIPMAVLYVLSREWVFPDTSRGFVKGFVYFLFNIGIGFVVMLAVFWALLQFTGLYYLVARIAASIVSGIVVFLLNGIFNFKEL